MPRADLTGDFRSDHGQSKFPKLRLQAGEKGRIVVLAAPQGVEGHKIITEYMHRLQAPNIVNQAPTYTRIKDQNGQEVFKVEMRFVANHVCLGDFKVLRERNVDERNCEMCHMAREQPEIFYSPKPRYAANVIRYSLRPGGGWNDLAQPYGASLYVWVFGPGVMDKLIDINSMGSTYADLRQVDLLIECDKDGYTFQKPYSNGEFLPWAPALWLSSQPIIDYTTQFILNNAASEEDLASTIGVRTKPEYITDDLRRVIQRWDIVRVYESGGRSVQPAGVPGFGAETLGAGLVQLQQQHGMMPQIPPMPQLPVIPTTVAPAAPAGGVDMGMLNIGTGVPAPGPSPAMAEVTAQAYQEMAAHAAQLQAQAAAAGYGQPPAGMSGLNEFMAATTLNQQASVTPPAAPAGPGPVAPAVPAAQFVPPVAMPTVSSTPSPGQVPPVPSPGMPATQAPVDPLAALSGALRPASQVAPPQPAPNGDSREYRFTDLVPPEPGTS